MKATSQPRQYYPFIATWVIATIFFGWQLAQAKYPLDPRLNGISILIMFLCTATLLGLIPNPIKEVPDQKPTKTGLFILLVVVSAGILFLIPTRVVRVLFFVLPGIAILVFILLKQPLEKSERLYALGLALLAGITGLGIGGITWVTPAVWGILQIFLVLTSLLAGWSIFQSAGLRQEGIGKSRFLSNGAVAAFKAFMSGALIAMPWAFGNVVAGGSNPEAWALRDDWLKAWWQPVLALQPGIAEEAWGRIFLVPLFFLIFRRVSQPRAAFTAALYVMAYWFAYLHTPGGLDGIQNAIMLGTLYSLPLSYLCLYHDLETAIGFHFWVDFIRFVFAFTLFNG